MAAFIAFARISTPAEAVLIVASRGGQPITGTSATHFQPGSQMAQMGNRDSSADPELGGRDSSAIGAVAPHEVGHQRSTHEMAIAPLTASRRKSDPT